MNLHRSLADAKLSGDLFAETATHDLGHNFTFARTQGFEAGSKVIQRRLGLAPGPIFLEA